MAPKKKKGEGKKAGRRKEKGFKGPGKILAYHDEEYWNSRYANQPEPFDWYQSYKELKGLFEMYLPKDNKILNAGCGNGMLGEDMVRDGYLDVVNVDNSSTCFDQLNLRYKGNKDIPSAFTWFRQDMKDLKMFKDFSMDHVIDKGFLDSILCAADALNQVALVFGEIRRVLKVGGLYILITYGDPRTRMPWLKTPLTPWKSIIVHVFRDGRSNQGASAQKEETSKGVVAEWREMPLKKYMILGIKSLEKRRPSKWQLCHG
nr:EEF1A lysine methyltransferase 4-like isoform X2 [Physcomitrium patens]|eukprot:XP_024379685.1 EEF1A lysine methyltransferase 4-like isoform X2 [Physcomitrella patens]